MQVTIYKTPGCGYFVKADELMERAGLQDVERIVVGKDITREEFKEKFPNSTGFPWILLDGKQIGGLMQTVRYFVDKKLVTARTK